MTLHDRSRATVGGVLALLVALAALNTSLTFVNIWPTLAVRPTADLSVELAVGVLVLLLVQWRAGAISTAATPCSEMSSPAWRWWISSCRGT